MPFSIGAQPIWPVSWLSQGPSAFCQCNKDWCTSLGNRHDKPKRESQSTLCSCENWVACGLEANSRHSARVNAGEDVLPEPFFQVQDFQVRSVPKARKGMKLFLIHWFPFPFTRNVTLTSLIVAWCPVYTTSATCMHEGDFLDYLCIS